MQGHTVGMKKIKNMNIWYVNLYSKHRFRSVSVDGKKVKITLTLY